MGNHSKRPEESFVAEGLENAMWSKPVFFVWGMRTGSEVLQYMTQEEDRSKEGVGQEGNLK